MRPEYDFSKGVRGKHAARYAEGTNVVVLEPDVALEFSTTEQVNETLRAVSKLLNNTENYRAARRHNTAMTRRRFAWFTCATAAPSFGAGYRQVGIPSVNKGEMTPKACF